MLKWRIECVEFNDQYARAYDIGLAGEMEDLIALADKANASNAQAIRVKVDTRKWVASKRLRSMYGDSLTLKPELPAPLGEQDDSYAYDWGRRVAFAIARGMDAKRRAEQGLLPALAERDITPDPAVTGQGEHADSPSTD